MAKMHLRSLLRHSQARMGHLGFVLEAMSGPYWALLGPLVGLVGPFWGFSGASFAVLWRS